MEKISNCVYGPVNSWRMGKSLGVDLLRIDSICSFACVYCQLGKINCLTTERKVFVPTAELLRELEKSNWREADVVTFSGSGEPTLAANLGEAIQAVKFKTSKPIAVLTNSSLLSSNAVRADLRNADIVFCKLDAWDEENFRRLDRPHPEIRLKSIIEGIKRFRREFGGMLGVQTMILKIPFVEELKEFARILGEISPDEVQLNLPLRPVPKRFTLENRGNRSSFDKQDKKLKIPGFDEITKLRKKILALTGLPVTVPPQPPSIFTGDS